MNWSRKYRNYETVPRRWWWMPVLDGYVFREFMTYFSILLFVFAILFFLGDVFNDLSSFLDEEVPWRHILHYFLLKLPGNIRFVLPLSVLLGCMWTMAMFGKHVEVTAMRASGISLFRCGRSIFVVGLLVTMVNFYFNEQLVPYTDRKAALMYEIWTKTGGVMPEDTMLTFRSPDQNHPRSWFFRSFDSNGVCEMVMVKNFRQDGTLEWDMLAESVAYDPAKGWAFFNVQLTRYSMDGLMARETESLAEFHLPLAEATETPDDMLNSTKDENELPSWVIYDLLRKTPNMAEERRVIYETVFFYRMAFPWSCFLAVFLGIPLATRNERSGIMLSVVTAIGLIVAYICVSNVFLVLGQSGVIPPVVAGLAPVAAFILFGWFRVLKDRN